MTLWLHGLVAAVIGAIAGALIDYLTRVTSGVVAVDWQQLATTAGISALLAVAGYFKHSPLPPPDALPGGKRATDPKPKE